MDGPSATQDPPARTTGSSKAGTEPRHGWRMIAIWAVLSAIADPIFFYVVGPHVPPGTLTSTANGAQFDFNVLFILALPVLIAIWVYMGYAILVWRASRGGPEPVAGPYGTWASRRPGRLDRDVDRPRDGSVRIRNL
jgi:hypothetical protein